MLKEDYKWYLTFEREGRPFILSEDHQDLKTVRQMTGMYLYSASLIEMKNISRDEEADVGSVVHHITFADNTTLTRIFRRTEQGLLGGTSRVIPSLEISEKCAAKFVFAFPDKVFLTKNSRYYREDWNYGTD